MSFAICRVAGFGVKVVVAPPPEIELGAVTLPLGIVTATLISLSSIVPPVSIIFVTVAAWSAVYATSHRSEPGVSFFVTVISFGNMYHLLTRCAAINRNGCSRPRTVDYAKELAVICGCYGRQSTAAPSVCAVVDREC